MTPSYVGFRALLKLTYQKAGLLVSFKDARIEDQKGGPRVFAPALATRLASPKPSKLLLLYIDPRRIKAFDKREGDCGVLRSMTAAK